MEGSARVPNLSPSRVQFGKYGESKWAWVSVANFPSGRVSRRFRNKKSLPRTRLLNLKEVDKAIAKAFYFENDFSSVETHCRFDHLLKHLEC